MSTPNFAKSNASDYYVVYSEDEIEDTFIYDDAQSNILHDLKEAYPVDKWDNDRSYSGKIFGEITYQKNCWTITFQLIMRAGYYSGANLDWDINIIKDTQADYEEMDWGYFNEKEELPAYILNFIEKKIAKIEKTYQTYAETYLRTALFSNGEAIYTKKSALKLK